MSCGNLCDRHQLSRLHCGGDEERWVSANELIGTTLLLYGLINPIGVIPVYLGLVQRIAPEAAHRIVVVAAVAVACLLATAAAFGRQILSFFNVGLDAFRIAGGLLTLLIAFEMFRAHYGAFTQTFEERAEAESDVSAIAITPLAFPLLVGPAEMSVMITLSNGHAQPFHKLFLVVAAALATSMVAVTLWLASPIKRVLGSTGINVATRLMALIVASVAVDFIVTGLRNMLGGIFVSSKP
jgi:multiple antibiotic resistance protein